jgi:hypothetical protein
MKLTFIPLGRGIQNGGLNSGHNKVVKLTVFPSLLFVLNSTNRLLQNCNLQRRYANTMEL